MEQEKKMRDLIDRQAAIEELKEAYWNRLIQSAKDDPCIVDAMADWAIRKIKGLPSAQPERKTGRWIDETFKPWGLVHHPYKCNQCGEHSEMDSDFCPNCGADMRGDIDG